MKRSPRERSIPAGEFKAKCLSILDEVQAGGHTIVVTKRGRPVARVVPLPKAGGELHGSLLHEEELLAPIDVIWDADT
ncbi:MAG: type II toxin-antitoxin system Phd/YefM family antitoxin [Myxococcota bacterium]|nr:type II toxin-antitoxin system Phd/YefM family antitoxin [Myxococcota bacterium]